MEEDDDDDMMMIMMISWNDKEDDIMVIMGIKTIKTEYVNDYDDKLMIEAMIVNQIQKQDE